MLQRIQSIYLALASFLILSLLFLNFGELLDTKNSLYNFDFQGIAPAQANLQFVVVNSFPISIFIGAIGLIGFFTIFSFKNRKFQRKLGLVNIILMLVLIGVIFIYSRMGADLLNAKIAYSFTVIFPLISIILTFLANRAIKKDEELLRSADRIR